MQLPEVDQIENQEQPVDEPEKPEQAETKGSMKAIALAEQLIINPQIINDLADRYPPEQIHLIAEHLRVAMRKVSPSFQQAIKLLFRLIRATKNCPISKELYGLVMHSFIRSMGKLKLSINELDQQALNEMQFLPLPFLLSYLIACRAAFQKTNNNLSPRQVCLTWARNFKRRECIPQFLAVLYVFDLQDGFDLQNYQLDFIAKNFKNYSYAFCRYGTKPAKSVQKWVETFIEREVRYHYEQCRQLIKKFHIDPQRYPEYCEIALSRALHYLHRETPVELFVLKISGNKQMARRAIKLMSKQPEAAAHLAQLAGIEEQVHLRCRPMVNILLTKDGFGPTEKIVYGSKENYVQLADYGIGPQNITWVNYENIAVAGLECLTNAVVGLDTENSGQVSAFGRNPITLLQVAVDKRIFLIDIVELKDNPNLFIYLRDMFETSIIVGQSIMEDLVNVGTAFKSPLPIAKAKVQDTFTMYKKFRPKDTKASLAHITKELTGKELSKYEQCSDWWRRPLRRTQIHYGALDCFLPLVLTDIMKKPNDQSHQKAK